jgi:hypothetical protein
MSDFSRAKLRSGLGPGVVVVEPGYDSPSVPAYLIPSNTETKVDGEYNIAIGYNALVNNSNVSYNMNDGEYSISPNLTGVNNTAVGDSSLHNTKGKNNTGLGYKTGISNIVGNNNTFLGNSADCVAHNLNNSTAIGYKSKITASNQIVLGNNDTTQVFIPSETASIQLGSTLLDQDMINSFASETYVDSAISGLKNGAGSAFDTLKEIADIIGDNTNLAGTLISSIASKAPINNPAFTGIVTVVDISGVTQTMVGLGNVDNTSDASKVMSGPIKVALDLKADSTALTDGLALKADSTALTDGLALKADSTALTDGLALKADSTALTDGLALKADLSASCRTIIVPLTPSVYADQSPPQYITPQNQHIRNFTYDGWYYRKNVLGSTDPSNNKINWYFGPDNEMTVGDLKQMYFEVKLINKTSPPFLIVYTKPSGTNNPGGWYKSSRLYSLPTVDLSNNTNYCCYYNFGNTIAQPVSYSHKNKSLVKALNTDSTDGTVFEVGDFDSSEEIYFFSFSTNGKDTAQVGDVEMICKSFNVQSNKGTINFVLSNLHVDMVDLQKKFAAHVAQPTH